MCDIILIIYIIGIMKNIRRIFMVRRKLPNILDLEEGNKLLKVPSTRYPTGIRNKAIISLMLSTIGISPGK